MRKFMKRYIPIRGMEGLTRTEKAVLCAITYNTENPNSRMSLKSIAKAFNRNYHYRRMSVKSLVDKGLCRYSLRGNEKLVTVTEKVTSTIQGRVPISTQGTQEYSEYTGVLTQSTQEYSGRVHRSTSPLRYPLYKRDRRE